MTVTPRLLVHVHLFYTEQVDFFISRLGNITIPFELVVTMCGSCPECETALKAAFPGVRIIQVDNCGYDVYPFLEAMKLYDLDTFDLVLKLHTKNFRPESLSMNHLHYRNFEFRDGLINPLVGSRKCFERALARFNDDTVGMVCANNFIDRCEAWQNVPVTEKLCKRYGVPYRRNSHYCAGTMFMCRTRIVSQILSVNLTRDDFPEACVTGQTGTVAHSIETMFGLVCLHQGLRISGVHDSVSRRNFRIVRLKSLVHKDVRWLVNNERRKKVLVDLSSLKHLNCGLGQVAKNYGLYFKEHAAGLDMEIHLLVPEKFMGAFGNDVVYHNCQSVLSRIRIGLMAFDVWHSIHQLTRFKPGFMTRNVVLTVHDLNFVYEKTPDRQKKYFRRLGSKTGRADKLVCISEFAKNDLIRYMHVEKPVEVLYNGVEFMQDVQDSKPASVPDGCRFLFTIGQMLPKKNFHVLLDAMKLMPEYTLFMAGSRNTDYAAKIEQRIKDEHIDNVHVLGEISHSEKVWMYRHCEAFVFPSLFEGFGLPVIEALNFGRPVVSSDKTSLKEIGEGHVFFLDGFEPEQIAAAVRRAVKEYGDKPELADANRQYAESFTYDRHMSRYVNIYRELML